jgi:hypothetical protein
LIRSRQEVDRPGASWRSGGRSWRSGAIRSEEGGAGEQASETVPDLTEQRGGRDLTERTEDLGQRWPGRTLERRAERDLAADAQASNGDSGQNRNRRWPGRAGGDGGGHKQGTGGYGSPKTGSDTMLSFMH